MSFRSLWVVFVSFSMASCISLERRNQYDEKAPEGVQAKASIQGRVVLEDGSSATVAKVVAIAARSGAARRVETVPLDDGAFLLELPADAYNLSIEATGYGSTRFTAISVGPGDSFDIGSVTLLAGRGIVAGTVQQQTAARAPTAAADAQVLLVAENGATTAVVTGPDGSFRVENVRAGRYLVRATRPDFAPAYTRQRLTVEPNGTATVEPLVLYPASAVVQLRANGVTGATVTNSRAVEAQLLAFVEQLIEMRVSEDQTFADPGKGDVAFRPFAASTTVNLGDVDGEHRLYAQFRDDQGLQSDVFSTSIVLDRVAPTIDALAVGGGGAFARADIVSLDLRGADAGSGVRGYQVAINGDVSVAPELSAAFNPGSVLVSSVLALGADGVKTVTVRLLDRAGNTSEPFSVTLRKDSVAPEKNVQADPFFTVNSGASTVYDRQVTLHFNVAGDRVGEPLFVALSTNSGLSSLSPRQPLADPLSFSLAPGVDGPRFVYARFFDEAGNASDEVFAQVTLNTTGGLAGRVILEVEDATLPPNGGATVALTSATQPGANQQTTTLADGSFVLASVPEGSDYVLTFSKEGFSPFVERDVVVVPGPTVARGDYGLSLARVTVTGTAYFGDKPQGSPVHAGITVADPSLPSKTAVTGTDGSWRLEGLPLGTYQLLASFPDYLSGAYPSLPLTAGQAGTVVNLPTTLSLSKREGDFTICRAAPAPCNDTQYIASTSVRVSLTPPSSDGSHYYVSNTDTAPTAGQMIDRAGQTLFAHTLDGSGADGARTVYLWFGDATGPLSGPFSASIVLDRTPPTSATVSIASGATYTRALTVSLGLHATDALSGVSTVVVSNEDDTFDGSDSSAGYQTTINAHLLASLGASPPGVRQVCVQYCDAVGNCTAGASDPLYPSACDSIVFDATPPTGTALSINNGADYTSSPFVTLFVTAGDAVLVRTGTTSSLTGVAWVPLSSGVNQIAALLEPTAGVRSMFAEFMDAAGNTSPAPITDTIIYDSTPPVAASVSIDQGDVTNASAITLLVSAAGADEVMVHVGASEDFSSESWIDYAIYTSAPPSIPLTGGDGTYRVFVKFRDAAHNESVVVQDSIVRDTVAPTTTSVAVDVVPSADGNKYASSSTVTLRLGAAGADLMAIAADGVTFGAPEAFATAKAVTLSPTSDGTRTVRVRYSDRAGNVSAAVSDSVIVDATAPSVSTFSVAPSPATNQTTLTVTVEATDSAPLQMMLSSRPDFLGASYEALVSPRAWPVTTTEEAKSVYLRVRDAAGNVTTLSPVSTILDTTGPTGSITINSGASHTNSSSRQVALALTGSDPRTPLQMMLSNDPTFAGQSWSTFSSSVPAWTLSTQDGAKTVYLRLRDSAGNVSDFSANIILDTQGPQTPSFALSPTTTTTGATVTAWLTASDAAQHCFYGDLVGGSSDLCVSNGWVTLSSTSTLTLTAGDGTKTVNAKVRDAAGNTSAVLTDSVSRDGTAPTIASFAIDSGATHTTSRLVALSVNASDATSGLSQMAFANTTIDCSSATYENFNTARAWTLPVGDGTATVAVCVKDAAGNTSSATDTIVLDTTAPTLTATVNGGATYATNPSVTLALTASDNLTALGSLQMQISQDSNFSDAPAWISYAASSTVILAVSGSNTVYVRVRDQAGNVTTSSDSIVLDNEPPYGASLSLTASGAAEALTAGYAKSTNPIIATLSVIGATQMCLDGNFSGASTDSCVNNGWEDYALTKSLTLTGGQGANTVRAYYRDAAGNRIGPFAASIILDSVAPVVSSSVLSLTGVDRNGAATSTSAPSVTANTRVGLLSGAITGVTDATSSVAEVQISESPTFVSAVWQTFDTGGTGTFGFSWPLSPSDATKTVYAKVRDVAGNESATLQVSIRLDTTAPTLSMNVVGEVADGQPSATYTRTRLVDLSFSASDAGSGVVGSDTLLLGRDAAFVGSAYQAYASGVTDWDLLDPSVRTCRRLPMINEVGSGVAAGADWIEIYNPQSITIDMSGWEVRCGNASAVTSTTVPNGTRLDPEGYYVVQEAGGAGISTSALRLPATCAANGAGYWAVFDATGNAIDFVRFNGNNTPPPSGTEWLEASALPALLAGQSYTRTSLSFDRDTRGDFCVESATPGTLNSNDCGLTTSNCAAVNGAASVFARVRDLAGNEASVQGSIIVDVTPPLPLLALSATDGIPVNTSSVGFSLFGVEAESSVTEMSLTLSPLVSKWGAYSSSGSVALGTSDGTYRVYARLRDAAGNDTPAYFYTDAVELDTSPIEMDGGTFGDPSDDVAISIHGQALIPAWNTIHTRSQTVFVQTERMPARPGAPTLADAFEMQVSEDDQFADASWEFYQEVRPFVLSSTDGAKTVYVRYRDVAGNTTSAISSTINLDTTRPSSAQVFFDRLSPASEDAAYTTSASVRLRFWVADNDVVRVRSVGAGVAINGDCTTPLSLTQQCSSNSAAPELQTVTLGGDDGTKRLQLYVADRAGNEAGPFEEEIFLDTQDPRESLASGPLHVTGASVRTTSLYVDFTDAEDPDAPLRGSGIDHYEVNADAEGCPSLLSDESDCSTNTCFASSEGWVVGLPTLHVYGLRVRAVDLAGRTNDWSACFNVTVGLSTSIVSNSAGIGAIGDRVATYRGFVLFPRTNGTRPELVSCDARYERCRDQTFTTSTSPVLLNPIHDTVVMANGEDLWTYGLSASSSVTGAANVARGIPDAVGRLDQMAVSASDAPFGGSDPQSFARVGSFAAAGNGRLQVASVFGCFNAAIPPCGPADTGMYVSVRSLDATNGVASFNGYGTRLMTHAGVTVAERESFALASDNTLTHLEAGDERFWLSWPSIQLNQTDCEGMPDPQCGVAVISCDPRATGGTRNNCKTSDEWGVAARLTAPNPRNDPMPPRLLVHSTRTLEVGGKVYVFALASPLYSEPLYAAQHRGLYAWSCTIAGANSCRTANDFGAPVKIKTLAQPAIFDQGVKEPRLSVEWRGGVLQYAATDYATGSVYYGTCDEEHDDCMQAVVGSEASNWTSALVLKSGDIRGQVNLANVNGNVMLFVGRDATRTFVLEPFTPTPMNHALVPNFSMQPGELQLKATWTPRSSQAVDGYSVTTGTSPTAMDTTVVAPDPAQAEVPVVGDNRYGVVASFKEQDFGAAFPVFHAARGGIVQGMALTSDSHPITYAENSLCHVVAYAIGDPANEGKLAVTTCPKSANCADSGAWKAPVTFTSSAPTNLGDFAVAASNTNVHLAWVADGTHPSRAFHDKRAINATCDLSGASTSLQLPASVDNSHRVGFPTITTHAGRVFVGYTPNATMGSHVDRNAWLSSCDLAGDCSNIANWSVVRLIGVYRGGALLSDASGLYWLHQILYQGQVSTRIRRCANNCEIDPDTIGSGWTNGTDVASARTVFEARTSLRRAFSLSIHDGLLVATSGSLMATCPVSSTMCTSSPAVSLHGDGAWQRMFYSPEALSETQMGLSLLGRVPAAASSRSDFSFVGIGSDGHGIARCHGRCFTPDNWYGGYTNRNPETSLSFPSGRSYSGMIGSFSGATPSVVFGSRDLGDARLGKWNFVHQALFEFVLPNE